jgi:SAM-dependent methyltransferase
MNSKDIVRQGYDKVSYAYRDSEGNAAYALDYAEWLSELIALLSPESKVLELGCGCGIPVAQILSKDFAVIGVDISPVQIERAKSVVPQAEFVCADMTEVDFPAESFAAIVSLYAVIHLPLDEQSALFAKLFEWLQPEGYLLVTVGNRAWTGLEENWLDVSGATMFWSHADPETYYSWLTELGFKLRWNKFIPEGDDGGHQLILAQKPKNKSV